VHLQLSPINYAQNIRRPGGAYAPSVPSGYTYENTCYYQLMVRVFATSFLRLSKVSASEICQGQTSAVDNVPHTNFYMAQPLNVFT